MSKLKIISNVVKAVVLVVACVGGYYFYKNYTLSQQKIEELRKIDAIFEDSRWDEAIQAYKDYIGKFPDRRALVSNKLCVALQNVANQKSIEAIAVPATDKGRKQALSREAITYLREAEHYGPLNEISYIVLCDAHVECGEYDQAREVISKAGSAANIAPERFGVQLRRIEQASGK